MNITTNDRKDFYELCSKNAIYCVKPILEALYIHEPEADREQLALELYGVFYNEHVDELPEHIVYYGIPDEEFCMGLLYFTKEGIDMLCEFVEGSNC